MFLLSHHYPHEYHRTYEVAGVRVCARCLGLYPVLFAALWVQWKLQAPLSSRWDPGVLALTLPALADWSWGRFRPASGSNAFRSATGALLGIALGRTLYVHFQRPFHEGLLYQLGLVLVVALPVFFATYRRPSG